MKKLLAATAMAAAFMGTALPADAAVPGLPAKNEPVVCTMQLQYTSTGVVEWTSGSGTCTGLLGLRQYQATVTPFTAFGQCTSPTGMALPVTLQNGSAVGHTTIYWGHDLMGLLGGLPLQLGLLSAPSSDNAPLNGAGVGIGVGPSVCSNGVGSTTSSATFVFLAPEFY